MTMSRLFQVTGGTPSPDRTPGVLRTVRHSMFRAIAAMDVDGPWPSHTQPAFHRGWRPASGSLPGYWLGISCVRLPLAERMLGSSHALSLNVSDWGTQGLRKLGSRSCAIFSPLSKLTAFQPVPVHIRRPKSAPVTVQRALTYPPRSLCTEPTPGKQLHLPDAPAAAVCAPPAPSACATTR